MDHHVTDECLSIFNINGSIRKGQKSKLIDKLNMQVISLIPQTYIAVIDMGFLWNLTCPSSEDREKQDRTMFTWHDYAEKVFSTILSRHNQHLQSFM